MKLSLKQIRKAVLTIILVLISAGVGYLWRDKELKINSLTDSEKLKAKSFKIVNKETSSNKDLDFSLFWETWQKLEEKYLIKENIDQQKMFHGAIQGMTAALGDPYTVFLPPKENKQTKEDLNGSFEGVGIRLGFNKEKRMAVIAPLQGMPAEAAGVRAGDLILHIKDEKKGIDESTVDMSLPEAVEKIRGKKGEKIVLTLLHENETEPFEAEIKRGTIIVASVEVEFVNVKDAKAAHLKLMRFGDLTAEQWNKSVSKIEKQKTEIKGVVLDLRGNPGGYLKGSINLASEFLDKGVIVKQENYLGDIETYSVNRKGRLLDIPLIVLIDRGSASASEILAGALRDHGRAKLAGMTSFGKGTIQESEEMGGGAALHITTAKWLTPNGVWVHEEGLKPDFEIEDDLETEDKDEAVEKAIEILTQDELE